MFKTFFFLILISYGNLFCQQATKIKLAKHITVNESNNIKLYRFDPKNPCDQDKALSIIHEGKISSCFSYVKTINTYDTKKIITLLTSASMYGEAEAPCYDTDYALLIFNKSNVVIG